MMVRSLLVSARTSSPHAVRRRLSGAAVLLTLLAVLPAKPVSAQGLVTPVSFDDRFAAVSNAGQQIAGTVTAPAHADKTDDPPQAAAPLRHDAPPSQPADARARYRLLVEREAAQDGIAPEIAEAGVAVEG